MSPLNASSLDRKVPGEPLFWLRKMITDVHDLCMFLQTLSDVLDEFQIYEFTDCYILSLSKFRDGLLATYVSVCHLVHELS